MRAKINTLLAASGIGLLLVLGAGCSHTNMILHTDPPPPYVTYYDDSPGANVTPLTAPPDVYYAYLYYPDFNVYYYPPEESYYWYESSLWQSDRHLPSRYAISAARHYWVHSRTRQPWAEEQKPVEGTGKPADGYGRQP
jgi:hypothetical protein